MTFNIRMLSAAALATLVLAAPVARAETEGGVDAALTEKVTVAMTALGYDVRSVGVEGGTIEVDAVKDGKTCEVALAEDLSVDHESCN